MRPELDTLTSVSLVSANPILSTAGKRVIAPLFGWKRVEPAAETDSDGTRGVGIRDTATIPVLEVCAAAWSAQTRTAVVPGDGTSDSAPRRVRRSLAGASPAYRES